jgi:hypothetical protein
MNVLKKEEDEDEEEKIREYRVDSQKGQSCWNLKRAVLGGIEIETQVTRQPLDKCDLLASNFSKGNKSLFFFFFFSCKSVFFFSCTFNCVHCVF